MEKDPGLKVQKLIEYEKNPNNKIEIPDKSGMTHPLTKKTEQSFNLSSPKDKFLTSYRGDGIFDIKVSYQESKIALRILDTLIKELERRKYLVYVNESKIFVRVLGVDITFSLKEKSRRITLIEKTITSFGEYDFIPTGKLILSIDNIYVDQTIRKNSVDNKSGRIEEKT